MPYAVLLLHLDLNVFCQQDSYSYVRPAAVTTYDNKQYYQTSIAPAQRTPTDNYYQTGKSLHFNVFIASYAGFIVE